MKQVFCFLFFLLLGCRLPAQTITGAEYFFDADPGAGMGTPLNIGTPAPSVVFSANVPSTSLSPGFHSLAIRVKDGSGHWGPFERQTVYVSAPASNAAPITAAEFFIDTDPGEGNGIALSVGPQGHSVNFTAAIPTTNLQPGFHHLVIRTRNADNQWGIFESKGFYIYAAPLAMQAITAAEYYIDQDPGAGNGTSISIGSSGNAVTFTAPVPTTSLTEGFHLLVIRTKNSSGTWGLFETAGFYVQPFATNSAPVTAAEYFLDADPGVGNGAPLNITSPGNTVSQNFHISIPATIPNGQHLLGIRVKDADGKWGLFELREFTVSGFPLPLNWLSFTAKRAESKVVLQWETANETNTSHFDVERSVNGIDFKKIGEVRAQGLAYNSYRFNDENPAKGLNYYRLKQWDNDSRSQYSVVAKGYYQDAASTTLKLFPQPASSVVNILFDGTGKDALIQIYDAGGKLVLNERKSNNAPLSIAISQLAKGTYWLVVSDGITLQQGQFIKQ